MEHLAHIAEDGRKQFLIDHLKNAALLAQNFGQSFDAGDFAYFAAFFHDLGKYSVVFDQRIHGAAIHVDHSTAGGQYIVQENDNGLGCLVGYCIFGHHGGLPDGGAKGMAVPEGAAFFDRLSKKKSRPMRARGLKLWEAAQARSMDWSCPMRGIPFSNSGCIIDFRVVDLKKE